MKLHQITINEKVTPEQQHQIEKVLPFGACHNNGKFYIKKIDIDFEMDYLKKLSHAIADVSGVALRNINFVYSDTPKFIEK